MDIQLEKEKLDVLKAEYDSAQSDYLCQLERDAVREDGSSRQDALHEQFLREGRDEALSAKAALVAQEKVVAGLSVV